MHIWPRVAVAGLAIFGLAVGASAAGPKVRVQGDIQSVTGNAIAIESYSGKTVDLAITPWTKFAAVVPASLSSIKPGDFVGVGATGSESHLSAIEVVIFPRSMRGTGEGHYSWSLPEAVAQADHYQGAGTTPGSTEVHGTMTNGTVAKTAAIDTAPPIRGTMTNGTVAGSASRKLTISYSGGKRVQIAVEPTAPVVRLIPADRSVLAPQAKTFAIATEAGGATELSANFVAVGENGLTPPM